MKPLILANVKAPYKLNDNFINLQCPLCKFVDPNNLSIQMSLEDGSYFCTETCGTKGTFKDWLCINNELNEEEAQKIIDEYYSLECYSYENNLPVTYLKDNLGLSEKNNIIKIPYYNTEMQEIAIRIINKEKETIWSTGSKANLYGLWKIKDFTDNSYIILVKQELPCQILWYNNIQALGIPKDVRFKKEYVLYLDYFEKIYIIAGNSLEDTTFKNDVQELLVSKEIYLVSSEKVQIDTNLTDYKELLSLAERIAILPETPITPSAIIQNEQLAEHVLLAENIMSQYYIKYYHEGFYVYDNGVYKKNVNIIEKAIQALNINAKKTLRNEVLEYIRIATTQNELDVDKRFINFRNGLYDIDNQKLVEHSPDYFVTTQIHAIYIEDNNLVENKYIEKFLDDITCNHLDRKLTLLQYTGYSMTFRTDFEIALILYGPTAKNGKSTFIELVNTLIGKENVSHVTMGQLSERFCGSELTDKLLNTETEVERNLKSIDVFKKVITGDIFSVEEKHKPRYDIIPFCKFIFRSKPTSRTRTNCR